MATHHTTTAYALDAIRAAALAEEAAAADATIAIESLRLARLVCSAIAAEDVARREAHQLDTWDAYRVAEGRSREALGAFADYTMCRREDAFREVARLCRNAE